MDKLFKKLDLDIEYDIILKNKLDLLIENKEWLEIFERVDSKEILKEKENLKSLTMKERENIKKLEATKSQKKRVMAKIITLSDEINNNDKSEDISLLEQSQRELKQKNEDIEELTYELEMSPKAIRESNLKLLETTVKYAYAELLEKESELEKTNSELAALRERLRECIVKKCDSEERIKKLYSFLHNSLGNEKINELDKNILK